MMNKFWIGLLLLGCQLLTAQPSNLYITMDSTEVAPGVPVDIRVKGGSNQDTCAFMNKFQWQDSCEIIAESPWNAGMKKITIRSWKPGAFQLPPLIFQCNSDSLIVPGPYITTAYPAITDTTQLSPIRDIQRTPFQWWQYQKEMLLGILTLLIIGGIYWWWKRGKNLSLNKPKVKQNIPCDIAALDALRLLAESKLMEQGQFDLFHTKLSEIMRQYIQDRWNTSALQSPNVITLRQLTEKLTHQEFQDLELILRLSDYIKYASIDIPISWHEKCLALSMQFVQKTRPILLQKTAIKK